MHRALSLAAPAAVVVLLLTACSGGGSTPVDVPESTTAAAPSPQDEARTAFEAYWDELVEIQNAGEVPDGALEDVAMGAALEDNVNRFAQYESSGLVREGQPRFKDVQALVQGTTATVTACINEDEWGFRPRGQELDFPDVGWQPVGSELTRVDDRWLVSGFVTDSEVEC